MSNTTSVTPYDAQPATGSSLLEGVATVLAVGVAGTVTAITWLAEETPAEKAAIAAAKEQDRKRQVAAALRITSVGLNLRDSGSLVASAKALGYSPTGPANSGVMLLQNATGQRLVVEAAPSGKVRLHSASGRACIETVVRQHTIDQVQRHLSGRRMSVRVARAGVAEVQVTGSEQSDRQEDRAMVTTQIRRDGTLVIDVNQLKGPRCERIVAGLVEAVGGEVTEMQRKHSFFELPGETTTTGAKVRG